MGYSTPEGAEPKGERPGTLSRVQQEQDWLQWRRTGVGAGDIATIMGWGFSGSSPYKKWAEVVGLIPPGSSDENEDFEYGQRAEQMLCRWFEDRTGLYVVHQQERRTSPELDIAIATIDGEVFEGPHNESVPVGEGRGRSPSPSAGSSSRPPGSTVGRPTTRSPICTSVRASGRCWCAAGSGCGSRCCTSGASVSRAPSATTTTSPSCARSAEHFWNDHVLTGDPPPMDDSPATRTALTRRIRGDPAKTTLLVPEAAPILAALREAKSQVDQWRSTKSRSARTGIKAAMGDATYLTSATATRRHGHGSSARASMPLLKRRSPRSTRP